MFFISRWKLFSFLRLLNFYPDLFGYEKNGLIRKLRLISKSDVKNWETSNYNIHIAQYLKK